MVPTANNNTPTPEPTGDLEQLFRQKLGEAEVAPRLHLWEQIDHELLVQQNETYRRRLVWHRWVAAACILLFLGAGSWFTVQRPGLTGASAPVAANSAATSNQSQAAGSSSAASAGSSASDRAVGAGPFAVQSAATAGPSNDFAAATAPAASAATGALTNTLAAKTYNSARLASLNATTLPAAEAMGTVAAPASAGSFFTRGQARSGRAGSSVAYGTATPGTAGSLFDLVMNAGTGSYSSSATAKSSAATWLTALSSHTVALPGLLHIGRPDTLKATLPSAPTMSLAQAALKAPEEKESETSTPRPRKWRLMGSYAAAAYNPNMSFASAAGATAAAPGVTNDFNATRSSNNYELAAREYRQNLRPGFAQRVALTVSYAATKHWTMSAGLQAAEQQATSQTSYSFLDGKLPAAESVVSTADRGYSLTPPRPAPLRTAQYRYRTAGMPVSVRYGSARNGVSLYAKVGAAVNVLFNSQSELVGVPEATTTYSLNSVGSPYRKVQGSVNGGAGVRYKPASAQWSLAVGPTAEAGLAPLNANPAQSSYQARPYAIGMEASVEFGGRAATVLH